MSQEKNFSVALSTVAGSSFSNIKKIFENKNVDTFYKSRKRNAYLVSALAEPFKWWESFKYDDVLQEIALPKSPVFILGHWRSGTTLLHNIMCQDPQYAYVTTYQSVFPNQLLGSKWLFKNIMKTIMPDKRPSDNMKLSADFPQEEEFALGNMIPYSYYNFWYFPNQIDAFYEDYIRFSNSNADIKKTWQVGYKKLMAAALYNHHKYQFISKNPPHTGRIKPLLELFPQAKFIFIYRNPITVFESTKKLFESTLHTLCFQNTPPNWIDESIYSIYKKLIGDYESTKIEIPAENLIEIKFEDFEKNLLGNIEAIYSQLHLPGFENAKPHFESYIHSQKKYQKNTYQFSASKVIEIKKHWQFSMEKYGYDLPEGMELV